MSLIILFFLFSFQLHASSGEDIRKMAAAQNPESALLEIKKRFDSGPLDKKSQQDLKAISELIFGTFYQEKTLHLYEMGKHLLLKDIAGAVNTFSKAAEIEPYNGKVLLALLRAKLALKQCSSAREILDKNQIFYPFIEELQLIEGQTYACMEESLKLKEWLENNWGLKAFFELSMTLLAAHSAFLNSEFSRAKKLIQQIQQLDAAFPVVLYWQWRLTAETDSEKQSFGEKYVAKCTEMTVSDKKRYLVEPLTCASVSDIKTLIKKGENP